jgi:TatD DNase family protein
MKLVDVHAHLESSKFSSDLDSVIDRFKKAGGRIVINSGTDPGRNRATLELSERYGCVRASFGLYPIGDYEDVDEELGWIEEHARDCVAIGEIGLDYNWKEFQSDEMREKQKEVFRKVLRVAKKIDRCVVVHSRKAERDAVDILEELEMKKVIMHCFNGRKSLIKRGIENGWSFSVPPNVVRLEHFKMLVEMVPLEQLLTETDAPWLSPVVGTRNEPANVLITLKEISRIKGVSLEEVAEKIFENACGLFGVC